MLPPLDSTREFWIATAHKLARPVLTNLADRTLHRNMPVGGRPGTERELFAHLEILARLLVGLAPWLELGDESSGPWSALAREAIDAATDPASPDYCNFRDQGQPLVDSAFLAQALLRAPTALWRNLDSRVQQNVLQALKATRRTKPWFNNWLLFSATVETALFVLGEADWDPMRIDYALRQHEQWYKGDGIYGDGPFHHADYYNSFVIHPMLIDIIRHLPPELGLVENPERIWTRAARYAEQQERMISPEGTFPPLGRSLGYRFGALQTLAQMAVLDKLPSNLKPSQVRCALTAVIRRMIEAPGTFDQNGWLQIGFCGAQPEIGEAYISNASLYLCAAGLLPLGLPATAPFWADADEKWTSWKAWNGYSFPIDAAIKT